MRLLGLTLELRRRSVQNRIAVRRHRPNNSLVVDPARELMIGLGWVLELGFLVRVLILMLIRIREHVHPRAVTSHDGELMPWSHRRNGRICAVRLHVEIRYMQHRGSRGRVSVLLVVLSLLLGEENRGRQQQHGSGSKANAG